jgi:hypothetical protein
MILKSILPVIVVSMVMAFLYKASKKKPKKDELGNIILQLPKLYPIIGVFVIISGIGLLIFAFFFAGENDKILASICSLIAIITGYLLFAKGYLSHIKVTDLGITETTMFGKQKEIKWNEIRDLSFGKVSLELKIVSSDKNIKAHMHLVGFQELVTKLESKTGKTKTEIGIIE